jgi:very-short-patch-repair endonuclease
MDTESGTRDLLVKVETLKSLLVSRARGGTPSDEEYVRLRGELMAIPALRDMLPRLVQTYRTIQEFWNFIQPKFPSYKERTEFLQKEFDSILTALEQGDTSQASGIPSGDRFRGQFPAGLPFGLTKPQLVVKPKSGSQVTMFEDERFIGVLRSDVYPNLTFAGMQKVLEGTPIAEGDLKEIIPSLIQTQREKEFFQKFAAVYPVFDGNVPVLVPQAWIQWHSQTKEDLRKIGSTYAADLYRVDFVAFWGNRRFAIMIDDISHYAKKGINGWDADEKEYAKRLREDRKLRKEGWEVFRVSNWEIRTASLLPDILSDLRDFIRF